MLNVYTLTNLKIKNNHSLQEIVKKILSAEDFNFFSKFAIVGYVFVKINILHVCRF